MIDPTKQSDRVSAVPDVRVVGDAAMLPFPIRNWIRQWRGIADAGSRSLAVVPIVVAPGAGSELFRFLETMPSGVAVFPGSTCLLSREAMEQILGYDAVRVVLCDALPEEMPRDWRRDIWPRLSGRYHFLPAPPFAESGESSQRSGMLVLSDRSLTGADAQLLEALRGCVPVWEQTVDDDGCESVAMASRSGVVITPSTNPGFAAGCAAIARASGAGFIDWKRVLSPIRDPLGRLADSTRSDAPLRPTVVSLLKGAARLSAIEEPYAVADVAAWVSALVAVGWDRSVDPKNGKAAEAHLSVRVDGESDERGGGDSLLARLAWDFVQRGNVQGAARSPVILSCLSRRVRWAAAAGDLSVWRDASEKMRLVEAVAEAVAREPDVGAAAAWGVFDGVCGGALTEWRWELGGRALGWFSEPRRVGHSWIRDRLAVLAGGLGRTSVVDLACAQITTAAVKLAILREILRVWMPLIDGDSDRRVAVATSRWWSERFSALLTTTEIARANREAWLTARLYLDDPSARLVPFTREETLSLHPSQVAALFVRAWMCGTENRLAELWAELSSGPAPADAGSLFSWAVAGSLSGARGPWCELLDRVEELDAAFFKPGWPANNRCFLHAIARRAIGQEDHACEWMERALRVDPAAPVRSEIFKRALTCCIS